MVKKIVQYLLVNPLLLVVIGLAPLLNLLGTTACHRIGAVLGYLCWRMGLRRCVVRENMTLAFGSEKNAQELRALERAFYDYLGKFAVDVMRNLVASKARLHREVAISPESREKLMQIYHAQPEGLIVWAPHQGNWVLGLFVSTLLFPTAVAVKEQSGFLLNTLYRWYRKRIGVEPLYAGNILLRMKRLMAQKKAVIFISDQAREGKNTIRVNFFGTPISINRAMASFIRSQ